MCSIINVFLASFQGAHSTTHTHHVHDQVSTKKTPVRRLLKARILWRRDKKDESATSPPVERRRGWKNRKDVLQQTVGNDQRPRLKLQANGVEIEGLVNTGVDVTHFTNILEFRMAT